MGSHRQPVANVTLGNGLQVILREDHAAPLASFWVFYRVGSRNELPGLTGASHWVEHMQFKGTPTIRKGQIFRDVSRHGGTLNALTSNDWTGYYETLPAAEIGLSLAIESDRMANSLFDPEETESERTVILSERQGAENSPGYLLYEEVLGSAFRAHPYRHMVIGHEADLRSMSRDDLHRHYRRFYVPNNAFVVAVGDFESDRLLERIEAAFGDIPAGPAPDAVRAVEPAQRAERRVVLEHPAATAYVRLAHPAPAASHPDIPALLVADAILSGGKGMGLGGGGAMGRSSRMYRSLVAGGIARSAGTDLGMHVDPHLFQAAATVLPGVETDRVEAALVGELEALRRAEPSREELERAIRQVKAQYVYSAEGVTNQAFWLGFMEIVDRHQRVESLIPELETVTPEDVRRVAEAWFRPETRTVGWLVPSDTGGGETEDGRPAAAYRMWGLNGPLEGGSSRPPFEREAFEGGLSVLGQAQPEDPSVSMRLRVTGGSLHDPIGSEGLALLTARSLLRGAAGRTFAEINAFTDDLGATISADAGRQWVEVAVRCLREDFPAMLALAADILRDPTFPEDEVEKVRRELLTGIRESDRDTRAAADRTMRRQLFPPPHPLGRRSEGTQDSVEGIPGQELPGLHRRAYGPIGMSAAVVGGFDRFPEIAAMIAAAFSGWQPQPDALPDIPPAPNLRDLPPAREAIPGKSQADLVIGIPTISRLHPDWYALDMANLVLGRLGLMGRLGANVRDRNGLAYYAYSGLDAGRSGSVWAARAGVDPSNVDRAREAILEELAGISSQPISDEELADGKSYLTGILPLALETNDGVAATLLSIEHYGLGLDYLDRYPAIVDALTADTVLEAARTHLDAGRMAVAVAGPPE